MKHWMMHLTFAGAAMLATSAFAATDVSSMAPGFGAAVAASQGAIVRVPVNAQGEELRSAAELRLVSTGDVKTSADASAAFEHGSAVPASSQLTAPAVAQTAAAAPETAAAAGSRDVSTHGWSSWGYGDGGWYDGGYYPTYTPTYYYYGNAWTYTYDSYYVVTYTYEVTYQYRYYYYRPAYHYCGGYVTPWNNGWY